MKKWFLFSLSLTAPLLGQTIAEKKLSLGGSEFSSDLDAQRIESLQYVNEALAQKRAELAELYSAEALDGDHQELLGKVRQLRGEINEIEEMWRHETASSQFGETHALWHQPESTVLQLVMDYGTADYLYMVPPDIGMIHCSLNSNLPIPRESWSDCLELILAQYGIGVKQHNAYLRELYFMRADLSAIDLITENPDELALLPTRAKVCFVLTPDETDPRPMMSHLQRFTNLASTDIQAIGGKLYITGLAHEVIEVLKLHSFIKSGNGCQDFQVVKLSRMDASQMERILNSAFHEGHGASDSSSLRVMKLENMGHSLFLSGTKEEVKKAQKLIRNLESQIEDPQEKTIFWYTAKHSDAEELATVLAKVYDLLSKGDFTGKLPTVGEKKEEKKDSSLPIANKVVGPATSQKSHKTADGRNNFIVDAKTGAIIMVVEINALPKIKELLKKLDVPKRMVQLEVLLFEKKLTNKNKSGLNLLHIGSEAAKAAKAAVTFNGGGTGILEFFISRSKEKNGVPPHNIAYQFLLSQDDVQINASPSITTMNQTPAQFAIVEEISIDAGANDKNGRVYNRAQYGIIIEVTPTINIEEGEEGFVTLDTDISFDTTKRNKDDRPDVTRRHIKNHVRIADGETLILGGLRQKNSHDNKDSIPFLGEIPGIGKLFSTTDMSDTSTEMFLFITPHIIGDPGEATQKAQLEELNKRPGDVPEFFHELVEAKGRAKKRFFEGSMTTLFGRKKTQTSAIRTLNEEYDGR
ncbi:MAG: Type 3 secretion system secretin [Chlamydiales bacterium]|nr:Type 3 secretion system secretin [Chlamydiales bacterium]MCH9636285.1 Type 3 secretion system secretin [Chlamydiales bacterium]MCH9703158.1 type II secretion system protein GspD [Chlamydiota bacterium]